MSNARELILQLCVCEGVGGSGGGERAGSVCLRLLKLRRVFFRDAFIHILEGCSLKIKPNRNGKKSNVTRIPSQHIPTEHQCINADWKLTQHHHYSADCRPLRLKVFRLYLSTAKHSKRPRSTKRHGHLTLISQSMARRRGTSGRYSCFLSCFSCILMT